MLDKLRVTQSFSRPHVSDDNPYSESQFKTMKQRPEFPNRFANIEDAKNFCLQLFPWYNYKHRHSGIANMTPYVVHSRQDDLCRTKRQHVLTPAYHQHPERFPNRQSSCRNSTERSMDQQAKT
jgi:putative transposase